MPASKGHRAPKTPLIFITYYDEDIVLTIMKLRFRFWPNLHKIFFTMAYTIKMGLKNHSDGPFCIWPYLVSQTFNKQLFCTKVFFAAFFTCNLCLYFSAKRERQKVAR